MSARETELQNRILKIKGQVEGIEKMINGERDCFDIMQQIAAVRSALAKVGVELLKQETGTCITDQKKFEKLLDSLFKLQ